MFAYQFSGTADYRFALCSNTRGYACNSASSASVLLDRVGGSICVASYGVAANTTTALLSSDPKAGISVTVSAGSACAFSPGKTLYSVFNIKCDPTRTMPFVQSLSTIPSCGIAYNILSSLGCGSVLQPAVVEGPATGWYVVLGVVGAGVAYLVGGIAWNRSQHGATGMEAVPNIALWRGVYAATVDPVLRRVTRRGPSTEHHDEYEYAAGGEDGDLRVRT